MLREHISKTLVDSTVRVDSLRRNGNRLSNSQACCLAQLCLAAAEFFSFPVGQTIYAHCNLNHQFTFQLSESSHEIRSINRGQSSPSCAKVTTRPPTTASLPAVAATSTASNLEPTASYKPRNRKLTPLLKPSVEDARIRYGIMGGTITEILSLKLKSKILEQWSNPVSG